MDQERYAPPAAHLERTTINDANRLRLHSLSAIGIAAFFGGPLPAGYLVYRNFTTLGFGTKAIQAAAWFGVGGLFAMYLDWHTPPDLISRMIGIVLPQLFVVLVAAQIAQGKAISIHRSEGGTFHSRWFAFAIGVAWTALLVIVGYGLVQVLGWAPH